MLNNLCDNETVLSCTVVVISWKPNSIRNNLIYHRLLAPACIKYINRYAKPWFQILYINYCPANVLKNLRHKRNCYMYCRVKQRQKNKQYKQCLHIAHCESWFATHWQDKSLNKTTTNMELLDNERSDLIPWSNNDELPYQTKVQVQIKYKTLLLYVFLR